MDYQKWIESIQGMAGIYSFDILPDGSYSEIRLMAVNRENSASLAVMPDAPEFYPGIPWRRYFTDINFESYIYRCGGSNEMLYSYANAHGFWLKGFYLPMQTQPPSAENAARTVYCLYVGTISPQPESDSMCQHSPEVASAVMNISIRLHQSQDFTRAMAATVGELNRVCGSENCALYMVDKSKQDCSVINVNGAQDPFLHHLCDEMGRTPYETALRWEEDLADSDCLILDDLHIVEERDPVWYQSLCAYHIRNIILYGVRFNQELVGFIWAADFDTDKMIQIKETLELTSFLIGAVIANHQLVSRLEIMSTVDALTQVSNRNALDARTGQLEAGERPAAIGVVYADLNGLKNVNDVGGHDAGDKLLKKTSALLKIVFSDHEVYRAGGDEFVILCPDITEEQLTQQTAQLRAMADNTPDVSFAVGAGYFSGDYDIRSAMQIADERMYQDKKAYYQQHPEKESPKRNGKK